MTDTVTILGNVANDPQRNTTGRGDAVTNFRLASSQRWYDNRTGTWNEGQTNWYDVSAFRQLAEHAKSSLRIGDPVIVTGRLKLRKWESNGKTGTAVEIHADAIGHNLRSGTSAFAKAHHVSVTGGADAASFPAGSGSSQSPVGGTEDPAAAWAPPADATEEEEPQDSSFDQLYSTSSPDM